MKKTIPEVKASVSVPLPEAVAAPAASTTTTPAPESSQIQNNPLADKTQSSATVVNDGVTTTVVFEPPHQVSKILATMSAFWDWFDKRDVDKHMVAIGSLLVTYQVVRWSMHYAEIESARPGSDIALVLGAIGVPLMTLQTAVIKWYFESRTV